MSHDRPRRVALFATLAATLLLVGASALLHEDLIDQWHIGRLSAPEIAPRLAAARCLRKRRVARALPALLEALRRLSDERTGRPPGDTNELAVALAAVIQELAPRAAEPEQASVASTLVQLLRSEEPAARVAHELLNAIGHELDGGFPILAEQLRQDDLGSHQLLRELLVRGLPASRWEAASYFAGAPWSELEWILLRDWENAGAVTHLLRLLSRRHADPRVRSYLLGAAARRAPRQVGPALSDFLKSSGVDSRDPDVLAARRNVIRLVGSLGPVPGGPDLTQWPSDTLDDHLLPEWIAARDRWASPVPEEYRRYAPRRFFDVVATPRSWMPVPWRREELQTLRDTLRRLPPGKREPAEESLATATRDDEATSALLYTNRSR